jgi:hypothetical protein
MQLAVLARQAEEARWTAEARRREQITALRAARDAPTGDTPPPAVGLVPIGLAPVEDWARSPFEDLLGTAAEDAPTPSAEPAELGPTELAPIELIPIALAPYEPYGQVARDVQEPGQPAVQEQAPAAPFGAAAPLEPFPGHVLEVGSAPAAVEPDEEMLPTREVSASTESPLSAAPVGDAAADLANLANLANLADLVGAIDLAALDGPAAPTADDADARSDSQTAARTPVPTQPTSTGVPTLPETAEPVPAELAEITEITAEQMPRYAPTWDSAPVTGFSPDLGDAHTQADTASLLRELSFLGLDDVPPPAPAPRPAPTRPLPAGVGGSAKPKRKSIFGR